MSDKPIEGRHGSAAERAAAVANVVHGNEMEGLTVTDEWRGDAAAFVAGEIDVGELRRRTRIRYDIA